MGGGNVKVINSKTEWDATIKQAKNDNKAVRGRRR